ncbi:MAG TPA: cytochrome c peroxidase [Fimbriimonadaceae bacterium]|nr:cytochrome c peroxidase [Fimbriimonadaceae bacterium]
MLPRSPRILFARLGGSAILLVAGVVALGIGSVSTNARPRGEQDPLRLADLGKRLFEDRSLSNPPGLACASCHAREAGFTYPGSSVNLWLGTAPGSLPKRFGNRKVPTLAYSTFLPAGPPHFDPDAQAYVGGLFWDGRADGSLVQVRGPLFNPNEMNDRDRDGASPQMVVDKIRSGPNAAEFRAVFGDDVFSRSTEAILGLLSKAIAAYEASPDVSPFTSKYDAYLQGKVRLTPQELLGMRLATGTLNGRPGGLPFKRSAHCMDCHSLSDNLSKSPDLFTNGCYANLGVPRNPLNPYYAMTGRAANPAGYNPDGREFVDPGLADPLYSLEGWPFAAGDPLRAEGLFKAPTLRNVDKRPYPGFVKCYMHNGYFKTLKSVVHFYNTRNLTTSPGEVIDFTKTDPYAGLKGKPLWPKPECLDPGTLINPSGQRGIGNVRSPAPASNDPDAAEIGDLGLTDEQENAIVAFLKTLSDGYFQRTP